MGRRPEDPAGFLNALPGEEALAQLEVTQLVPALRLGLEGDLPARLHALTATPARQGPTLDQGFGDSPVVQAARRMVADLLAWRQGEIGWEEFSHSMLLYGPLGTGKTWLAIAMGHSAGIACVKASFAEWQAAGHLGDMLAAMRKSFAAARRSAPAIMFIDEIDAVGSRSSRDTHAENYRTQVMNGFLGEMNALALEPCVIVVGGPAGCGAKPWRLRPPWVWAVPACSGSRHRKTWQWVASSHNRRHMGPIGYIPPAEAEEVFHANLNSPDMVPRTMNKSPSGKNDAARHERVGSRWLPRHLPQTERNSRTKGVAGRARMSCGLPTCSIFPIDITTTQSASSIASS